MSNKILICDDDEEILNMLKIMLIYEGFDVIANKNSSKVHGLLKKHLPDILIVDLWMPVMPGYEVIKQIRSDFATLKTPILAISASIDGNIAAMEAGANAFVAKPFNIDHLVLTINKLIGTA
jgi:DNA-binding response OmpR family regulator